jgi:hypothetical protein
MENIHLLKNSSILYKEFIYKKSFKYALNFLGSLQFILSVSGSPTFMATWYTPLLKMAKII